MRLIDWLRRLLWPPASQATAVAGVSPFRPAAGPSHLVILRHAEKTGDKRDPHLSPAGTKRAERLVGYIPAAFGTPQFLIAARTSKRSRRPVETLEPLAAALALEIVADLDDEDCDDLVRLLASDPKYHRKRGIISWRHSDLPRLVAALGAPGLFPEDWHDDDYTSVVDINYADDGSTVARRLTMPF